MMQDDSAALRVLSIGGTGTISSSCVRLSLERGDVGQRLERGQQQRGSATPDAVTWLTGDVTDDRSLLAAIGDQHFDSAASYPVSRRSSLSTERPCG